MVQVISILFDVVIAIVSWFFEALVSFVQLFTSSEKKTEYDADFLPAGEILSSFNKGFCLTGKKSLSIQNSFKNALVIGSTGNYKSSGILIPSVLKMRGRSSLVINDPSGELLQKTSGALLAKGYKILVLNYGSMSSEGYNPLARLSTVDIFKVSKMLVVNSLGTGAKDPFWNISCENLISLLIRYLLEHTPKHYHSLYNVYHLVSTLSYAPEKVDKLFVQAKDQSLLSEYKAFLASGDKTLASIISTCRAALAIFGTDPMVALNTSYDTIDFAEFRTSKVALYINTGVKDMRYYSVVTSLFLDQFFGNVMSKLGDEKEYPLFFLIDEASSLYFSNLQLVCSNIRKSRSALLQIYQSASQLQDLYGAPVARAITENSYAKVYMSGQPIDVGRELSMTLGSFEYRNEKGARVIRPLATPNEIREMKESLILCGNHRAIREKVTPYFKQHRLRKLSELKPYEPISKCPFEHPPLLEII